MTDIDGHKQKPLLVEHMLKHQHAKIQALFQQYELGASQPNSQDVT
jgi:hypothetical protein